MSAPISSAHPARPVPGGFDLTSLTESTNGDLLDIMDRLRRNAHLAILRCTTAYTHSILATRSMLLVSAAITPVRQFPRNARTLLIGKKYANSSQYR